MVARNKGVTVSYLVEQDSKFGGRKEVKIDMPRFARDLAKALDKLLTGTDVVKLLPPGEYAHENQSIQVGNDVLDIRADNWKKKVNAYINAPDVVWGNRNTYEKSHRTESASVNPDGRTIEAIAKDINKRVVVASQEALAKQREWAAANIAAKAEIVRVAAALKDRVPGLDIRVNVDEKRAAVYSGSTGHYLSGSLSADGTVSVDRIGSVSVETFARIVAILNEGGAA